MTDNTLMRRLRRRPRRDDDRRKRGFGTFLRDVVVIFLAALLISFLIKTFLIRSFYIPSGSMENTLQINDRIIVNELVPDLVDVKRGDVVVFTDPGGWLEGTAPVAAESGNPLTDGVSWFLTQVGLGTQDSNDHLIKRVIGLPGDTVSCCNDFGQMSVNGVPLDEPYVLLPPGEQRVSGDDFSVTVPEGALWVMGDNRYNSKDSRYNGDTPSKGFVPTDDVVGRAFVISWPVSRWTWLDDWPDVFRGTDRADG
ncbi:signal peptidase I [Frigoribacterium sp. PhB160]|uniref:signal peptidase I n=1 Tax=Frigoribacterium sp. PhB160 TaxID=2485192 RepID=UPI000F9CA729|nr:signal peptidase I [Frigoribacterium sp. PhB160]